MHHHKMAVLAAFAIWIVSATSAQATSPPPLLAFAASSATNAIEDIAKRYEAEGHGRVITVFDATSRAARQIAQGAPAHLLISANPVWTQWLAACGHGIGATTRKIASGEMVLVAPVGSTLKTSLPLNAHHPAFAVRRLAIADPAGVPAGVYARETLVAIGAWEDLSPRLLTGDNVRTILGWVSAGAVDAALVYATDAAITDSVITLARVPAALHSPISYEAVATSTPHPKTQHFLDYLQTATAQNIFAAHGFLPPLNDAPAPALAVQPACG